MHIALWVAQIVLAAFFIMGAIMKFLPIEKMSQMMPWMGEVPALAVRLLGVVDLLGALGLLIPSMLRIRPRLTPVAAVCIITLMLCAIIFHISRNEAHAIGVNIFSIALAAFIAWGRWKKAPIQPR